MQKGIRTEPAKPAFDVRYLAAYGTLRRRSQYRLGYSVGACLKFYGYGLLRGLRFAQREYPAVLEQPGLVQVEIFRVLNESVWAILDRYEGYDPGIGKHSLFVRKAVALVRPRIYAWVYFVAGKWPSPKLSHSRYGPVPESHCPIFHPSNRPLFQANAHRSVPGKCLGSASLHAELIEIM